MQELRWSPLIGAQDWDTAISTASAMVRVLDTSTMRGGDHWKDRAADLLAPFFHWAALYKLSMRETRDAIYNARDMAPRVEKALEDRGAVSAVNMLASVFGDRRCEQSAGRAGSD